MRRGNGRGDGGNDVINQQKPPWKRAIRASEYAPYIAETLGAGKVCLGFGETQPLKLTCIDWNSKSSA
jgi:hypothetical protein